MIKRFCASALVLVVHLAPGVSAADEPFAIELSVRADAQQQTARGRSASATPSAKSDRPVLTAKSGSQLRIRWSIANQEKTETIKDVTVHVFLDKETAIGQAAAPKPGADVPYESALVMDFAPQGKSTADFTVQTPAPGLYLLRVETIGATKAHHDDCLAAIDVKVIP